MRIVEFISVFLLVAFVCLSTIGAPSYAASLQVSLQKAEMSCQIDSCDHQDKQHNEDGESDNSSSEEQYEEFLLVSHSHAHAISKEKALAQPSWVLLDAFPTPLIKPPFLSINA